MNPLTPCSTLSTDTDPLLQQQQTMDSSHNFQPTVRSDDSTPDSALAPPNSDMTPGLTSGIFQNLETGNAAETANNSGSQGRFYVPEHARQTVHMDRNIWPIGQNTPALRSAFQDGGENRAAHDRYLQQATERTLMAMQAQLAQHQAQRTQQAWFGTPQHGKTVHPKPLLMDRSWNSSPSSIYPFWSVC